MGSGVLSTLTFKGGWPAVLAKNAADNTVNESKGGSVRVQKYREDTDSYTAGNGIILDMTETEFAEKPKYPYNLICIRGKASNEHDGEWDSYVNGVEVTRTWPDGANPTGYFQEDKALPHFFVVDNGKGGKKLIARCYVVTFHRNNEA